MMFIFGHVIALVKGFPKLVLTFQWCDLVTLCQTDGKTALALTYWYLQLSDQPQVTLG